MLKALTELVTGPVTAIIEARSRRKEVDAARDMKEMELIAQADNAKALWELESIKANASSWKDEYVTVVISLPAILSFICPDVVHRGFQALGQSPEWYQYTFLTVMLAAVGINVFTKVKSRLKKFGKLL